jgi:hypothetical protein
MTNNSVISISNPDDDLFMTALNTSNANVDNKSLSGLSHNQKEFNSEVNYK